MFHALSSLLLSYGYVLIFCLMLMESAGFPLPGETMFVLAATYAANGRLSILGVMVSAGLGAILGDMGGYWIGRRGGAAVLKRLSGRHYNEHLSKGRAFFDRFGPGAVFLARFVPVVRVVGANLAGMTEMPFSTFTLFNATGGVAWAVTMGSLGYFFGNNLPYLEALLSRLGIGVIISVGIIAAAIWMSRQMTVHETETRARLNRLRKILGMQKFRDWLAGVSHFKRNLALTVIGGIILAAFSGWMFGALAEDVLSRDSMTLYDAGVGRWLLSLATEDSSQFFYLITLLGSTWIILPASLLLGGWLFWQKRHLQLGVLALNVGVGTLLNLLLKNIFLRPRPDFANAFYHETGYSFPSGHAMLSVIFYGMAAYLLTRGLPWKGQVRLGLTAITISILIGFSRIFLGVHYMTDVLGGWAAGIVWLTVCIMLLEAANFSSNQRGRQKMKESVTPNRG